jgi:hypothetical protein
VREAKGGSAGTKAPEPVGPALERHGTLEGTRGLPPPPPLPPGGLPPGGAGGGGLPGPPPIRGLEGLLAAIAAGGKVSSAQLKGLSKADRKAAKRAKKAAKKVRRLQTGVVPCVPYRYAEFEFPAFRTGGRRPPKSILYLTFRTRFG